MALSLFSAQASPSQAADYLTRWFGGDIVEFDVQCVHYREITEEQQKAFVEAHVAAAAKAGRPGMKILGGLALPRAEEIGLFVRTNAFLIEQRPLVDGTLTGLENVPGLTMGWASNALWHTTPMGPENASSVMVDYEMGGTCSSPWEMLHKKVGEHRPAAAYYPLLAMSLGIEPHADGIRWEGESFVFTNGPVAGSRIEGRLVTDRDRLLRAEYDYIWRTDTGPKSMHATATLRYRGPEDPFPEHIRIEKRVQGADGVGQVNVDELSNIVVRLGPDVSREVPMSPGDFVDRKADVVLVTVKSNGWLFTAFSGGHWIKDPAMVRADLATRERKLVWPARLAVVLLFGAPLAIQFRRWLGNRGTLCTGK